MTPTPPAQALAFILRQLRATGCLVLTGAGVSTDSGIPDYRGPNGSLTRHRPMTYQEFQHDPEALRRYWARSFIGWRHMDEARPNSVHRAIAAHADLIVINKFSKQEASGSGLRGELADAITSGIPVLTAVPQKCIEDWRSFAGEFGTLLPPSRSAMDEWWLMLSSKAGSVR